MNNRRSFIKLGGLSLAVAATGLPTIAKPTQLKTKSKPGFTFGLASYSLRNFTAEQCLDMTQRVGLSQVCLKSMHLPLDSSDAHIQEVKEMCSSRNIELLAGGVIYMKSKEDVDQAFDYAKKAGMLMIVGVPEHELLPYVEEKVKSYNIKLAIHNHGPGDEKYPSLESINEKIKNLDTRIGMCHDIGHSQRIQLDPVKESQKYFDRIFDFHIKDVTVSDSKGENIEIGRGVIDIPAFLKFLVSKKYAGSVNLEYEKSAEDPLPGLAESVGYLRGVMASI
ncbi:MAG: sugar phosphate isomerase/epimerase [Cyclobacteriaceae bacterium]|nr:sugar phosphate isomerase/epimerase [Cyclobacteriaceae bacterium]